MYGDCEVCGAREAIGTFDVEDCETALCAPCSTVVDTNGRVIIQYSA